MIFPARYGLGRATQHRFDVNSAHLVVMLYTGRTIRAVLNELDYGRPASVY
jgi:pyrimidine operon attenuation protein/uracil phosphoribosyltransferase